MGQLRLMPVLSILASLFAWQALVGVFHVPDYILPGPLAIGRAFFGDAGRLLRALLATLSVTLAALAAATLLGVALACLSASSRWLRALLQPWTVILQVTPIVAIAPLIIIWVGKPFAAMVTCATVVAFFPVYANTLSGLEAAPGDLQDVFRLNGATRWQEIRLLRLPAALPYFLAGLRISGGLALVGAVVAEFVTGAGGIASGLAFRILEAGYRLEVPRMFAALALLAAAGLALSVTLSSLSRVFLRDRA